MCSSTSMRSTASGYKSLNEGDKVEFEVEKGPKGLAAANVSVIQS